MKKQSKLVIGITAGILFIAVVIILSVLMAFGSDSKKYAKHMETAQRYMDELQYGQAVAEYQAAIMTDPGNAETYHALAELYVLMEDYESAVAVLNQGIGQTSSDELSEYIEKVQEAYEGKKALEEEPELEEENTGPEEEPELEEEPEPEKRFIPEEELAMEDPQEPTSGNVTRAETVYNEDGTYYIYEYDENENCVKKTWRDADRIYYIYEYDGNGNCVRGTSYQYDGACVIKEYDGNGILVKETDCYADGMIKGYRTYEHDEYGNVVRFNNYSASGMIIYYYICEYDGNGIRVKGTNYHNDGTYSVDEYDGNGTLVKVTGYNADGSIRQVYEY